MKRIFLIVLVPFALFCWGAGKELGIAYQYLESRFWVGLIYEYQTASLSLWRQIQWFHDSSFEKFYGLWALEGASFFQIKRPKIPGQFGAGIRIETEWEWTRSTNEYRLLSFWPQVFVCWRKNFRTQEFTFTHWIGMAWSLHGDLNWFWPMFRIQFSLFG
jgi:hypothetical protein